MRILAIESSCDETAASVVEDGTTVRSSAVATSHDMHEKYGGIVPEVAARAQISSVIPVITEALAPYKKTDEPVRATIARDIDAIAVTVGPGLIGSLLIGVETAKTLAVLAEKPIIPVNHVLAHMYANFVRSLPDSDTHFRPVEFPAISLVVSGGHTELYLLRSEKHLKWLGGTLDDAAGECFDKSARLLGFGNGGGLAIQEAAGRYSPDNQRAGHRLPRPMLGPDHAWDFSFSGLKTAIFREVQSVAPLDDAAASRLAHEIQSAITDVLIKKTIRAAEEFGASSILLSGGVSANLHLRERFLSHEPQYTIHTPPIALCTDNAIYIASYAYFRGKPAPWQDITAIPDLSVEVSS